MTLFDLRPYITIRTRMLFLPGLIDLLLARQLLAPFHRLGEALPGEFSRFSALRGHSLDSAILQAPWALLMAVFVYLLVGAGYAVPGVALNRLWHRGLIADGKNSLYLAALLPLSIPACGLGGEHVLLIVVLLLMSVPAVYHLLALRRLEGDPLLRYLVRRRRERLATLVNRYDLLSLRSVSIFVWTAVTAWRVYLGCALIGALSIAIAIAPEWAPRAGIDLGSEWMVMALELLALICVLILRHVTARGAIDALARMRSRLVNSAQALSAEDTRPGILFLRSFQADAETVLRRSSWGFRLAFLLRRRKVRLEEVIADVLFAHGPLIALHNPSHEQASLGAAKLPASDASWQESVDSLLGRSAMLVFVVGGTGGLRWEVIRALERGSLDTCILVFPPSYRGNATARDSTSLVDTQPELAAALEIRSVSEERERLRDAIVAFWRAGELYVLRSSTATALEYEEALRMVAAMKFEGAADE